MTQKYIEEVIEKLGSDSNLVRKLWKECIPVGEFSEEQELSFIIASMPGADICTPKFLSFQLNIGPEFMQDWGVSINPGVVHQWAETYPQTVQEVSELYQAQHDLPIDGPREFMCMCALREQLRAIEKSGRADEFDESDVEGLQSVAIMWLYEAEKEG